MRIDFILTTEQKRLEAEDHALLLVAETQQIEHEHDSPTLESGLIA
jgi:hypothetical protein